MSSKKIGIIEAAMRNRNIVIIITLLFLLIGVVALKKMPRNEFPQFTIRQGVIVGVYPGATSAEVEAQLTRAVENYIFEYKEVKKAKTYSQSKEGIMYIFVELNDDVKNADQFWSKLKHGLSELKSTLPAGVLALIANSDFGDTSALLITLSSETKSYKELEEELKKLKAECRKIPAVSKIKHYGLQKEQIYVNIKPELLNEYNIKSISLLGSYMSNGMVNYAGVLKDGKYNLSVHLPPNFESEKDLADQIVYSDPRGNVVRLKNIASIERRYEDPVSYIKQNGKKAILLSLEMQPGNNIVEFGDDIDKAISKFQKNASKEIKVAKISELPKYVDDSIDNFMKEFFMAIVAVILVTMILLPLRVASVAGITVPISVLVTLCFLYFTGIELHTVSLAALIIVLGMIVDNSIVVIDNHVEKIDHGISPWHAAIKSAKELVTPIITATLAIMAAYIPLGFMLPGMAGEFVTSLPIVITIALVVSILIAIYLVPYLNFVFIKKGLNNPKSKKKGKSFLDRLQGWFDFSLEKAFKHPKMVIMTGVASIVLAVLLFKVLDQRLFPEVERNQFAVEITLPTGTSLESTAKVVDSLENLLLKDKRITNVTSFTGSSSPRFHTVYAPNMPSPNYGQLLINTISNEATRDIVNEYSSKYSDCFANAHVKWKILALQGFKAPIEIRISSDSIKDIRKVETEVMQIVKQIKHIEWIRNDWDQQQQNVRINLDRDKANRLGYSKGLVATSLMIGLDGLPLTTIWEDDYPVQVRLSQETKSKKSINTLGNQYITSPSSFSALPLRSLASFSPEWTEGTIVRRNGIRTLTIQIDNDSKRMSSNIFSEIRPQIEKLKLPEGTSIEFGGEYESQNETFIPMSIALGLSVILIFFILLFQFKKIKLSLLIMSTMLLSLPGAVIGLTVMGYPFSLTGFIGITSLCGMVVRNGIILIDYARDLKEKNKIPIHEAAIAAGKRRMRPIFLTSAAAAVGVIPMILSRSPLWGPLGTVICFGLLISMVLTLYILPILYSFAYSNEKSKPKGNIPLKGIATILVLLLPLFATTTSAQSLSLDSCKYLAIQNNNKLKQADLDVRYSIEQRKSVFTNYFPIVNANAIAMRSSNYLIEAINALDYLNTAAINVSMPLYVGGKIRNGNKLATLGEEIYRDQKSLTTIEVLSKTENLYWTILSLKEKLNTLQSYQVLLDSLARDVQNLQKAGIVQRNDLLKVQLKQNETYASRLKLENGIAITTRTLCQHIGIPYSSTIELTTQPSNPSFQKDENIKSLVENRIEYKLLNKSIEIEKLQKRVAFGDYMPQLSVSAIGYYADAMNNSSSNTLALLNLSIPISDWWGGSHKIKQQQIKIDKARNTLDESTELLELEIEQARNEVNESIQQIEVAEKSVEQARENLKISEDNYKAGIIGMSDLLEAQALYQSSKDNLIDSKCMYQIKLAKYLQATGTYHTTK